MATEKLFFYPEGYVIKKPIFMRLSEWLQRTTMTSECIVSLGSLYGHTVRWRDQLSCWRASIDPITKGEVRNWDITPMGRFMSTLLVSNPRAWTDNGVRGDLLDQLTSDEANGVPLAPHVLELISQFTMLVPHDHLARIVTQLYRQMEAFEATVTDIDPSPAKLYGTQSTVREIHEECPYLWGLIIIRNALVN